MLYSLNMGGVGFLPIHRLLFDISTCIYFVRANVAADLA